MGRGYIRVVNGILMVGEALMKRGNGGGARGAREGGRIMQKSQVSVCSKTVKEPTHHGHTTSPGPRVTLGLVLVERTSGEDREEGMKRLSAQVPKLDKDRPHSPSLEQRLVDTSTTGNDSNGGTGRRGDGLLGTRWETDAGLALVNRVSDDGGVVSRGTGKSTTVTGLLLDVADDGSLGAGGNREDVSDREGGLLTAVDERTGRDSLGGDESLLAELVAVRVAEDDAGKRGTSTGIVNDLFHDTFDVPVALGKVKSSDTGRVLTVVSVRLENPTGLSLVEND